MKELIDKSALVAEIERIKKEECPFDTYEGRCKLLWFEQFHSFLNTLEVEEIETPVIPKHSYFEQIYHCGSEPRWKIGDVLAAYEFYSDHEGEHVYGEVIGVRNDETCDDWIYTMKGNFGVYEDIYENMLISDEAYKKN